MGGDRPVPAEGLHGFALALTSFVGRDKEVAEVAALLGEYRLVTVTGPGGMGKTRLAGEVAGVAAGRFADGAWLVELAAVRDPALVAAAVAGGVGVKQVSGLSVTDSLIAALGRRQLLLVLDNCEHLVDSVAELCSALLTAADDVRVLATSREPVGSGGEIRFRLRPLSAPEPEVLAEPELPAAVRLFADRARQADPQFALDGESGPLVARLVARLDGMPLAIELAAARTLMFLGRVPEAVRDAGEALEVARQIGYRAGEVLALAQLSRTAQYAGDMPGALEWARQARRILATGELGWTLRFTGHFFTAILMESGDIAAARRSAADSLAWAREAGDLSRQASGLAFMADLELRAGDIEEAGKHLRAATEMSVRSGERDRLIGCLDLWGYLCAAKSQWADAVTIWAAFSACLEEEGSVDPPLSGQRRQERLRKASQALGTAQILAAGERGAAMTLETAVEFALMVADVHHQAPPAQRAPVRLASLSAREQELITLVSKGRTDAQIASQLFISISTVRSHLDRIRDKTSCRRRADLTRLALQAGLA